MTGDAPEIIPSHRRCGGVVPTLKKRADFLRLAKGLRHSSRAFSIQAGPAADGVGRFGFTVTKKTGSAPARNRIRRRLRAAARAATENRALAFDLAILGRQASLGEPFDRLTRALETEIAWAESRLPPSLPATGAP